MIRHVLLIILFLFASTAHGATEPDHEIHNDLRGLLRNVEQAIETHQYDELEQYFDPALRITTINQEFISKRPQIKEYFNKWFGAGRYLKNLKMQLTPDDLTELYCNKTIGIVRGSGKENYTLSDGRHFDMDTRWTATVIKNSDGKWRILSLHIGTNFLDNPIYNDTKRVILYTAIGSFIAGVVLTLLISRLAKRKSLNA